MCGVRHPETILDLLPAVGVPAFFALGLLGCFRRMVGWVSLRCLAFGSGF